MRHAAIRLIPTAVALCVAATPALAHVGDHPQMGFADGMVHPFTGIDHMLAMIAVGLWAVQIGGRALWLLPLTFPLAMAAGAAAGLGQPSVGWVEFGIAASVLILGAAVALRARLSLILSLPLIGLFAVLHGYAHGVDLSAGSSALAYGAGFVIATLTLHLTGVAIGLAAGRLPQRHAVPTMGGAIACAGLALLVMT